MEIDYFGYSHIGGKKENEDSYEIREMEDGVCAVLADGLGGHGGGRQASQIAVRNLVSCGLDGCIPDPDEIVRCMEQANCEIMSQRMSERQMKTTVVFLYLVNNKAVWAHIGDSRLYHYYNDRLADYTVDHSVSQLAVTLGEIDRSGIPGHIDRSRLLRVLGDRELRPEIHGQVALGKGFHAFLMCTDGFWEYVTEDEMLLDLCKSNSPRSWIHSMQLRHEGRVETGHDNHTAVALFVHVP